MAMWKTADPHTHWRDIGQPAQDAWRRGATAARDVMLANGWRKIGSDEVVLPRWPDKAMIKSGSLVKHSTACDGGFSYAGADLAVDVYRAMIAAKDE